MLSIIIDANNGTETETSLFQSHSTRNLAALWKGSAWTIKSVRVATTSPANVQPRAAPSDVACPSRTRNRRVSRWAVTAWTTRNALTGKLSRGSVRLNQLELNAALNVSMDFITSSKDLTKSLHCIEILYITRPFFLHFSKMSKQMFASSSLNTKFT